MASSYGLQAQGQVAFTQAGQRAMPVRSSSGGGPDSAASTPDRGSNTRQDGGHPSQGEETKEGITQEGAKAELGQLKVLLYLCLCLLLASCMQYVLYVPVLTRTILRY